MRRTLGKAADLPVAVGEARHGAVLAAGTQRVRGSRVEGRQMRPTWLLRAERIVSGCREPWKCSPGLSRQAHWKGRRAGALKGKREKGARL